MHAANVREPVSTLPAPSPSSAVQLVARRPRPSRPRQLAGMTVGEAVRHAIVTDNGERSGQQSSATRQRPLIHSRCRDVARQTNRCFIHGIQLYMTFCYQMQGI